MDKLSQEQSQEIYQRFEIELREMIIKLNFDTYFIDPFDIICAMDLLEDSIELLTPYNCDLMIKLADLVISHCEQYSKFPIDSKEFVESNLFYIKQIQKNKDDFVNDMVSFKQKIFL